MLTAKDIEKLKGTFATKEDLRKSIKKSTEETKRHFDVVAEEIKNSIAFFWYHGLDKTQIWVYNIKLSPKSIFPPL